jgi:hypothetical protein
LYIAVSGVEALRYTSEDINLGFGFDPVVFDSEEQLLCLFLGVAVSLASSHQFFAISFRSDNITALGLYRKGSYELDALICECYDRKGGPDIGHFKILLDIATSCMAVPIPQVTQDM